MSSGQAGVMGNTTSAGEVTALPQEIPDLRHPALVSKGCVEQLNQQVVAVHKCGSV